MLRNVLAGLVSILLLTSCSPDEPLITNFDDTWRLLVAQGNTVSARLMSAGNVVQPSVHTLGGDSSVTQMRVFRENVYLCSRSVSRIDILNRATLAAAGSIATDTLGPVADITFANATTAYATHPGTNVVSVIDLTVNRIVRTIAVSGQPQGIACIGNQIAVACATGNTVRIIDSRSNSVVADIATDPAPWYVEADGANTVFCIATLGAGKMDEAVRTAPHLVAVDALTHALLGSVEINGRGTVAAEEVPAGLAISSSGYAYVAMQGGVVRVSTRLRSKPNTSLVDAYSRIWYNAIRAELVLVRTAPAEDGSYTLEVFDEFLENQRAQVSLPSIPTCYVGIAR